MLLRFEGVDMDSSYDFSISLIKLVVYIISLVILIPLVRNNDGSVYISLIVYASGKAIDYYERIRTQISRKHFVIRIIGIIVCCIVIVGCFYSYSDHDLPNRYMISMGIASGLTCTVDTIEMISGAVRLYKTKKIVERGTE